MDSLIRLTQPDSGASCTELEFVRSCCQRNALLTIVHDVLSDLALRESIARRSYTHVNRFDKIVLVDANDEDGYRLTLHVWWPRDEDVSPRDEPAHNHRFDFWSTILSGQLRSTFFLPASSDCRFQQFEYWPEDATSSSEMRYAVAAGLKVDTTIEAVAGDSYFLPCDVIHSVSVPRDKVTSTLVLRGPRRRQSADVYLLNVPQHDYRVGLPTMTSAELARKLELFLSILDA